MDTFSTFPVEMNISCYLVMMKNGTVFWCYCMLMTTRFICLGRGLEVLLIKRIEASLRANCHDHHLKIPNHDFRSFQEGGPSLLSWRGGSSGQWSLRLRRSSVGIVLVVGQWTSTTRPAGRGTSLVHIAGSRWD